MVGQKLWNYLYALRDETVKHFRLTSRTCKIRWQGDMSSPFPHNHGTNADGSWDGSEKRWDEVLGLPAGQFWLPVIELLWGKVAGSRAPRIVDTEMKGYIILIVSKDGTLSHTIE